MKRMLINFLSVLLLIACSKAESDPLSSLVIGRDKITGTVVVQFAGMDGQKVFQEIVVDCAVPSAINTNETRIVTNRHITEKDISHALKAIGQPADGTFSCTPNSAEFSGNWDVPASSDLSKYAAAEQAIRIGLTFFEALGIDVDPLPRSIERPNDHDAYLSQTVHMYAHIYSDPSRYIKQAEEQWKRTHRYETLSPNYTTVQFTVMADGIRVWPAPAHPALVQSDTSAFSGYAVNAYVTVSDNGVIVEAGTSYIPQLLSRTQHSDPNVSAYALNGLPQFIAAETWQDALCFALEHGAESNLIGNTEEYVIQDSTADTGITRYGARSVITSITPYLYPVSKDNLVPVWYIECACEYADGCRF